MPPVTVNTAPVIRPEGGSAPLPVLPPGVARAKPALGPLARITRLKR
jgi:hypothetical protein